MKPKVSIICTAYNHENFIRDCIEGFLIQETDFPFEVLVHDDASTDNTADIIREYERKYPEIIKPIYQIENQYSQGKPIISVLMEKAQGKYIAICEGDDFWTDKEKLQKQVNVMDNNTDVTLCVHKVNVVKQNGEQTGTFIPNEYYQEGIIPEYTYMERVLTGYPFQTCSYFVRMGDYRNLLDPAILFKRNAPVGDKPMLLYFGSIGKVWYIDSTMSSYRKNDISSFTKRFSQESVERKIVFYNKMITMVVEFNKYTEGRYSALCNKGISMYKYIIACETSNYKEMIKPEYREFLIKEGRKGMVNSYLQAYFPLVMKGYKKLKR